MVCSGSGSEKLRKQRAAEEAAQRRTFRALDGAMRIINQMLGMSGDMFGSFGGVDLARAGAASAATPAALAAAPRPAGRSKRVSFRARARSERDVTQARASPALVALHATADGRSQTTRTPLAGRICTPFE